MTKAALPRIGGNFDLMQKNNLIDKTKTVEDNERHSLALFQTDASVTVVSALSATVSDLATKVADMVALSCKSEYRAKYQILRDYTVTPNVLTAVAAIRKAVNRQNGSVNELINLLSRNTSMFHMRDTHTDAGLDFISRVDACEEEFSRDYADIKKQLTDMLRPFKCSDPLMLYHLVYCMYMARRFDSVARYVRGFAYGFAPGEPFNPMLHLKVLEPLERLANHMLLTDKHEHQLVFLYNKDDVQQWERTIAKKNWQKKHAVNPPVVVNLHKLFADDQIVRISWRLETHMFELKTIDKLIAASEGHDPEYRKDYRFKRLQSCASTYEQALLNQTIYCNRWSELPTRLRQFVDSLSHRKSISPVRKAKPVVCFALNARRDKRGDVIYMPNGEADYSMDFCGIWHSAYEAETEIDVPWKKIRRSVELKAVNDGTNHVWLSLEDYVSMVYDSMLKLNRNDIAEALRSQLPEFSMKTLRQMTSETKAPQKKIYH